MALAEGIDCAYPVVLRKQGDHVVIGVRELIRSVVEDVAPTARREGRGRWASGPALASELSAKFHNWLVRSLREASSELGKRHGIKTVALSGGCFQNAALLGGLERALTETGFRVITNHLVPSNDGGISFGQAVVAAAAVGGD
jgi:hydrogenase maturation protein HypF